MAEENYKNQNKEHVLVKEFLRNHSLVESNIISFNDFVENRMQEIVSELNENISNEDFEIKLGKISIEKPNIFIVVRTSSS
jgi:DNA-directed RNA polymerase subunit B"